MIQKKRVAIALGVPSKVPDASDLTSLDPYKDILDLLEKILGLSFYIQGSFLLKKIHDSIQPSDIDILGVQKSPFSIKQTKN